MRKKRKSTGRISETHFEEIGMAMAFDQQTSVHFSEPESTANELIKLIRKLRWIGMDEEAERLQKKLASEHTDVNDTVIARSGETD
jgi:hypothetical protein